MATVQEAVQELSTFQCVVCVKKPAYAMIVPDQGDTHAVPVCLNQACRSAVANNSGKIVEQLIAGNHTMLLDLPNTKRTEESV